MVGRRKEKIVQVLRDEIASGGVVNNTNGAQEMDIDPAAVAVHTSRTGPLGRMRVSVKSTTTRRRRRWWIIRRHTPGPIFVCNTACNTESAVCNTKL